MDWELHDELDVPRRADEHMATDLAMLQRVLDGGPPMVRLYRWRPAALTIGRHQDLVGVDVSQCRDRGIEIARRPTGGRALLHGGDLTYAVAMYIPEGVYGVLEAYSYIARGLIAGLARIGVQAGVAQRAGDRGLACFASAEGADIAVNGRKLCGSAQLQRQGALLQHGSVLVERLPVSEPDLLVYNDGEQQLAERQRLISATITLEELGATTELYRIAAALIAGCGDAWGARFTSGSPLPVEAGTRVTPEGLRAPSLSA